MFVMCTDSRCNGTVSITANISVLWIGFWLASTSALRSVIPSIARVGAFGLVIKDRLRVSGLRVMIAFAELLGKEMTRKRKDSPSKFGSNFRQISCCRRNWQTSKRVQKVTDNDSIEKRSVAVLQ